MMLVALLLLACTRTPIPADTSDSAASVDTADTADTAECREDGESCTVDPDNYRGDCCLSRQTCFPEGCYYSDPTE